MTSIDDAGYHFFKVTINSRITLRRICCCPRCAGQVACTPNWKCHSASQRRTETTWNVCTWNMISQHNEWYASDESSIVVLKQTSTLAGFICDGEASISGQILEAGRWESTRTYHNARDLVWPSGKVLGRQADGPWFESASLSFLFKSCGLWTLSCDCPSQLMKH